MRIQMKFNYGFFALLSCTSFISYAQQPTETLPNQVRKGKWMISHDLFSTGYYNEKNKDYNGNGDPINSDKTGKFYSSFSLISPSWSSLNVSAGKTHWYDENNVEDQVAKNSSWAVGISPSIGHFVRDRLLLGARVQLYFSGDQTTNTTSSGFQEYDYKSTSFGIGPELRYYFGKPVNKRLFHAGIATNITYQIIRQTTTTFNNGSNTTTVSTYDINQPDFRVEPYLGSSWFRGKHWTFTGMLFFSATSSNYKLRYTGGSGPGKGNTKTTTTDIGLKAGVNYTF